MSYIVVLSAQALEDADRLERHEPKAFDKFLRFLKELEEHPQTGTGHPEPLRGDRAGQWSRQITKKHRMIYEIFESEVHVDVLSAYGHYGDK